MAITLDAVNKSLEVVTDSAATVDVTVDWVQSTSTSFLPGSTDTAISSATTTTATVWLSGGTAGKVYQVRCRVTTAGGRVDDRTFELSVTHR
jgi:hypothetical protein